MFYKDKIRKSLSKVYGNIITYIINFICDYCKNMKGYSTENSPKQINDAIY